MSTQAVILCIDDDQTLLDLTTELLENEGYKTLQAKDGKTGYEVIIDKRPDLIVCDIDMPGMDGHMLLRSLREKHPELANIPFLFLTGHGNLSQIEEGIDLGADDYFTKPVDYQLLLRKVHAAIRQKNRLEIREAIKVDLANVTTHEATMVTVQDIVNNFLQTLQVFSLDKLDSGGISETTAEEMATMIHETAAKINKVAGLERVVFKEVSEGIFALDVESGSN